MTTMSVIKYIEIGVNKYEQKEHLESTIEIYKFARLFKRSETSSSGARKTCV